MRDIRDDLFRSIYGRRFRAALTAERAGVLAGTEAAKAQADELGIELELCKADGEELMHGSASALWLRRPSRWPWRRSA